jgi:nitrous oxidase accessory protein NosD
MLPVQTSQCIISKNIIKGIYGTSGITIYGKYNTISDNEITECGAGVFVGHGSGSVQVRPFGTIVTRNNFINNSFNAGFATAWFTRWMNNYWDDYQGEGAYEIRGKLIFLRGEDKPPWIFDWKNFDRHPAQEPYTIA